MFENSLPSAEQNVTRDSTWYLCTLSTLCQFYRNNGKRCLIARERGKDRVNGRKLKRHPSWDWHSAVSVYWQCCCAWKLACRLSHLPSNLEVTLDLGHALLILPKSTWLTLIAAANTFIISSSGLLQIVTNLITLPQEMSPQLDHSKTIVADFSTTQMFSPPPPSSSKPFQGYSCS